MSLRIIFPADPFQPRMPDEAYVEELAACRAAGHHCSTLVWNPGERPRAYPALNAEESVLWRGWMLTVDDYAAMCDWVAAAGAMMVTNPEQYVLCHHLPKWYPSCVGLTPNTIIIPNDRLDWDRLDLPAWPAYFVKDFVKSLTTSRGSVAGNIAEVREIAELIASYRGGLEGGLCVREFEDFDLASERRFFVVRGQAFAAEGSVPDLVHESARCIDSPFFSVDAIMRRDGEWRIVELGDGQVSDRKHWSLNAFCALLGKL
jgi:hypothetical protein